jgi:hypothetical protein
MKIAFFIHEDYTFTYDMLRILIPELRKKHQISGIISFPDVLTKYTGPSIPLKYLEIFGLVAFTRLALVSLRSRLKSTTFQQLSEKHGIYYWQSSSPNNKEVIDWLRENNVDLIFTFIGHIMKNEVISAPKYGLINKHASVLPANKGVFPVFWSMLKGDEIGFSLHKVTKDLDSGEIVYQKKYPKQKLSLYEWYKKIYEDVPDAILSYLEKPQVIQSLNTPSYHGLPTRKDVLLFYEMGFKVI